MNRAPSSVYVSVLLAISSMTFAWAAADCIVDSTTSCCNRATLPSPTTCQDGSRCPVFLQANPEIPLSVTMHSDGWKTEVVNQPLEKCTYLLQDCVSNGMGGYVCAPQAKPQSASCLPTKLTNVIPCTTP